MTISPVFPRRGGMRNAKCDSELTTSLGVPLKGNKKGRSRQGLRTFLL